VIKLNPNLDIYDINKIALWELGQESGRTRPLNADLLFQNLKDVKEVFDKHHIKYCLSHGTALGIYRQNDPIPNDDDTDLAVFHETDLDTFKKDFEVVREELRAKGFFVPQCGDKNKPIKAFGTDANMPYYDEVFIRNGEKVECWIFTKENDFYIYDKPRCGNDLKHSAKYYDTLDLIIWREVAFPIPGNIEEYLCMMYGSDWSIPQNKKYRNQT
jgi:hypothetical protein